MKHPGCRYRLFVLWGFYEVIRWHSRYSPFNCLIQESQMEVTASVLEAWKFKVLPSFFHQPSDSWTPFPQTPFMQTQLRPSKPSSSNASPTSPPPPTPNSFLYLLFYLTLYQQQICHPVLFSSFSHSLQCSLFTANLSIMNFKLVLSLCNNSLDITFFGYNDMWSILNQFFCNQEGLLLGYNVSKCVCCHQS